MPTHFLKSILSGYSLEKTGSLSFFLRDTNDPIFCLLPFWISQEKIRQLLSLQKTSHTLIYLKPLYNLCPPSQKLLLTLQPLYFMTPQKNKSFLFHDRRYLKTLSGPYLLPPLSISLSPRLKSPMIQSLEETLLFPSRRNTPFCFQGDTTHRLQQIEYLQRLQKRQTLEPSSSRPIYSFFKKILDS
ncbi:MAG: hypothetical protein K2Y01_10460 [Rhabdochlamydiaceae bacterium]|nr:hypothetical protein [Rhabdochlamydiaceae bacterium]